VGNHYEVKNSVVTKYYFAGTTRIAARSGTNGTLSFLLSDHLGSSSLTTDAYGNMTSRHVLEETTFKDFTLNYDAENRLVSVTGAATANFYYDADGKCKT
jgi:hypothetical protein